MCEVKFGLEFGLRPKFGLRFLTSDFRLSGSWPHPLTCMKSIRTERIKEAAM